MPTRREGHRDAAGPAGGANRASPAPPPGHAASPSGQEPGRRASTGPLPGVPAEWLDARLLAALAEDLGVDAERAAALGPAALLERDLTTAAAVGPAARARARLVAKEAGVLCGLDAFLRVFELLGAELEVERLAADGERVAPGREVLRLAGRARALLTGERTALNLLQRLSGVATLTARFVEAAAGRARVLDTRKTTPLWRPLERYAVRCGGGENHRKGLFDAAMVKDNHHDLGGLGAAELVAAIRARSGVATTVVVEARDAAEAEAAVRAGADVVLLDNQTPEGLARLCPRLRALARELEASAGRPAGRPLELEASGGVRLANAAAFAASGVDRISVGALTHSAPALDLSLELERAG